VDLEHAFEVETERVEVVRFVVDDEYRKGGEVVNAVTVTLFDIAR